MPPLELVSEMPDDPRGVAASRDGAATNPDPLAGMEARLRLHPGRRLEIVEELAADLEALEDELVARGVPRREARVAALRRLLPDSDAISALEATHGPDRARATPIEWLRRWERVAVLGLTAALIGWLAASAAGGGLRVSPVFVAVELALVGLMFANWATAGLKVLLGDDLRRDERRRFGRRQTGLIVAAFAAAALGTAVEAYALTALGIPAPPGPAVVWSAVARVASTAALGLAAPVIGLLAWLSLTPRFIRYERIEARIRRLFRARGPRLENGEGS